MRWRGRSGSRDLNAIYNMYSSHNHDAATMEKGKEVVTTVHAQHWPLTASDARTPSPQLFNTDRQDGAASSAQGSYSRQQRRAQAQSDRKRKRRRSLIITCTIIAACLIVGLAVGLGVGLTIGARDAAAKRLGEDNYYVPPEIPHTTPENDLMIQMFEWNIPKNATHWATIVRQLQNLKVLGVKNMWIPPAAKNADRSLIGYDVYDLWDLGEFNSHGNVSTNMGTKKQLQYLTDKAKDAGIGVIFDAVLNQRSGGDAKIRCQANTVNNTNRLQVTSSQPLEIEGWLQFDFKERNGKYSSKTWGCDDFTGTDTDLITGKTDVYKIIGTDNDFETDVSNENGNYDYLLLADVAYRNPSVRADVLAWVKWLHNSMPVAGFRLDAAKHISRGFIKEVIQTMADTNNGNDKFFAAEFFTDNLQSMTEYIDDLGGRGMMFDTLLLTNFAQFGNSVLKDLSYLFNHTFIDIRPQQSVTFVSTHDTQPGQTVDVLNVQGWFLPLAYATILLRQEGLPCLFFGDVYGTYDTWATSFTFAPKRQMIANMAIARKYWAYGTQTDYFDHNNNKQTVGWTRQGISGDRPDGLAAVLSINPTATTLRMNVGSQHAGETWYDITGSIITRTVTIGADGNADFPVRGQSASVWINQAANEGRDSLNQFDGDVYHIAPYEIGHATNDYETGGELGSQRQVAEGISQYRLEGQTG